MQPKKTVRSGFLLAALGMVYGDIATSPLYVLKYITAESGGDAAVSEALVLGTFRRIKRKNKFQPALLQSRLKCYYRRVRSSRSTVTRLMPPAMASADSRARIP